MYEQPHALWIHHSSLLMSAAIVFFQAKLIQTQAATVYCSVTPSDSALATAIETHVEWIQQATATPVKMEPVPEGVQVSYETDAQIKDATMKVGAQ
jgi:hypothetical protein